jgi:regulator of sigma E protease
LDLTQFLPQFGGIAFTLLAFILALSIIVAVHEYGHYIVGRWTGIHAEVFSLGFGPVLFARRDRRGTLWQVAALPFGGYVKFLGDANAASVGGTEVAAAERRRTMLGAPLWARSATVAAGPVFNFVLSLVLFWGILMWQGTASDPMRIASLQGLPPGFALDLREGDEVLAIGPVDLTGGSESLTSDNLPLEPVLDWKIRRDGEEMVVQGPYPFAPIAMGVALDSGARAVDMQAGDVILALDGKPLFAFVQIMKAVAASEGRPVTFDVWRAGTELTFVVTPRQTDILTDSTNFETRWAVGLHGGGLFFTPAVDTLGASDALGAAARQIERILLSTISGMYHIIIGDISSCNISGPVGIAQASGAMAEEGLTVFLWWVAVLSTAVGLLNLFPIPILDGGHLVFHAWEALTGRPPSGAALRFLMVLGLTLILALTVFGILNDILLCV